MDTSSSHDFGHLPIIAIFIDVSSRPLEPSANAELENGDLKKQEIIFLSGEC